MGCFAGIDLGSSGIKIALVDENGIRLAAASRSSPVDIPKSGWCQQRPEQWWTLTKDIFDELAAGHPDIMSRLSGLSLSGHMLGQVLLDENDRPTTPCILWNDQRSIVECDELLERVPDIGWRTNGHPDPGLTAPKLLWLAKHDPGALRDATILVLPKDYVRLKLTGERASDITDASGTMLLDCATGTWDDRLIEAAGWSRDKLPNLLHSHEPAGQLRPELCRRWSTPSTVTVAAGCGDNFAGALGVGASSPGRTAVSIGTSGVLSSVDGIFRPAPDHAILTTPHAAPDTFLSMAVVMSATQSLDWLSRLTKTTVGDLADMAEHRVSTSGICGCPVARPSITGVRTPDNRPDASAYFGGITSVHDMADIAYSVLEGVAFQFFDGFIAQRAKGVPVTTIQAVGGGSRSVFWVSLIATLFELEVGIPENGDISGCLGASRLAHAAVAPQDRDAILARQPAARATVSPVAGMREALLARHHEFRALPFTAG